MRQEFDVVEVWESMPKSASSFFKPESAARECYQE